MQDNDSGGKMIALALMLAASIPEPTTPSEAAMYAATSKWYACSFKALGAVMDPAVPASGVASEAMSSCHAEMKEVYSKAYALTRPMVVSDELGTTLAQAELVGMGITVHDQLTVLAQHIFDAALAKTLQDAQKR